MANKWITHIKKTMRAMKSKGTYKKGLGLKQVIKEAKKSWSNAKKGGAEPGEDSSSDEEMPKVAEAPVAVEGARRRRRHGKTARKGRK